MAETVGWRWEQVKEQLCLAEQGLSTRQGQPLAIQQAVDEEVVDGEIEIVAGDVAAATTNTTKLFYCNGLGSILPNTIFYASNIFVIYN